ncbi:MAG TPA: hypothetical protein VKZ80_00170 [Flavobacterium sp.]|nr:hypothetical protein [Flavobacterium sp.]
MVYKFRVILDAEEDVLRDIAINDSDTLEDLHNAIINAFGFDGMEGGSFFLCDDNWNQEDEIPLFDMGDVPGEEKTMKDFQLHVLLHEEQTKILYIYDPFVNWTFFVELAAIENEAETNEKELPALLFSHGILPDTPPVKGFDISNADNDPFSDFDDDYDDEDFDMFEGEDFEEFGYDDNY